MESYWRQRVKTSGYDVSAMFPVHQQGEVTPEMLQSECQDVSELLDGYVPDGRSMKVLELGAGVG